MRDIERAREACRQAQAAYDALGSDAPDSVLADLAEAVSRLQDAIGVLEEDA